MADTKQVASEFVDAFNAHDEGRIRSLNTDDTVIEAPGDVHIEGTDGATAYAMGWLQAFPDARITIGNELVDGDWAVQEFTFSGTHDSTLMTPNGEVPATHRKLNGRGVQILKIKDGKVADTRLYFDQVQVLTQLGLMPEPATA
jgi:steroid delta-isomerase-like uncharacterized protein